VQPAKKIRSGRLSPRLGLYCIVLGVFALGVFGCSSAPVGSRALGSTISPEEIRTVEVGNAYELVERLRPLWLRTRGGRSTRLETEIVVYLNGSMLGGTELLRGLPIEIIAQVEALDSAEAGLLPGLGSRHVERAILITTRVPHAVK